MNTTYTIAERVAGIFDQDGSIFQLGNGKWLDDVCLAFGATEERGERKYNPETEEWEAVPTYDRNTNTWYRYLFPDASAIVVGYDSWDIEGEEPFTMAGA